MVDDEVELLAVFGVGLDELFGFGDVLQGDADVVGFSVLVVDDGEFDADVADGAVEVESEFASVEVFGFGASNGLAKDGAVGFVDERKEGSVGRGFVFIEAQEGGGVAIGGENT